MEGAQSKQHWADYSWGSVYFGACAVMWQATDEGRYEEKLAMFAHKWVNGLDIAHTDKGLAYILPWGPLRHAVGGAGILAAYARGLEGKASSQGQSPEEIMAFAEHQVSFSEPVFHVPGVHAPPFAYGCGIRRRRYLLICGVLVERNVAAFCGELPALCNEMSSTGPQHKGFVQVTYALGASGHSWVVGYGCNPPVNPHHRDSALTMEESGSAHAFSTKPRNAYSLVGALVGGPDELDSWQDSRTDYKANEVALDYNAAMFFGMVQVGR